MYDGNAALKINSGNVDNSFLQARLNNNAAVMNGTEYHT